MSEEIHRPENPNNLPATVPEASQTIIVPPPEELPASLRALEPVKLATRIARVVSQIADRNLLPGPPGKPWAERDSLVKWAGESLGMDEQAAEDLVMIAHAELWAGPQADLGHVQKRLALERLKSLKESVKNLQPREEVTYAYEYPEEDDEPKRGRPRLDGGVKERAVRKKVIPPDGLAQIQVILKIERAEAEMLGIVGPSAEAGGSTQELLRTVEEQTDGKGRKKQKTSIAHSIKTSSRQDLPDNIRLAEDEILKQALAGKAKRVESTEVKPEDPA